MSTRAGEENFGLCLLKVEVLQEALEFCEVFYDAATPT